MGNQTLGTSYSETTNLLEHKHWQQEVLMTELGKYRIAIRYLRILDISTIRRHE